MSDYRRAEKSLTHYLFSLGEQLYQTDSITLFNRWSLTDPILQTEDSLRNDEYAAINLLRFLEGIQKLKRPEERQFLLEGAVANGYVREGEFE